MASHNWRWWLHAIHRDLGYLCTGLIVVYAVSGIAVNHVADWNPNYAIEKLHADIGPVPHGAQVDDALAQAVLARLQLSPQYKTLFQPGQDQLRIIRQNHTIDVDLCSGAVVHEIVTPRPILHASNVLHLNHKKGVWTLVADVFAVSLALLAISGMFLLKGRNGIKGRGLWLTGAGVLIPLLFLWLYA